MNRTTFIAAAALFTFFIAASFDCISAKSQQGAPGMLQQPIGQRVGAMPTDYSSNAYIQQARIAHWTNVARQKQLVKDSAKLIELTAVLKQHMAEQGNDKVNEHDIRLVTQIEKLARNIREGMAYAGQAPSPVPPPQVLVW